MKKTLFYFISVFTLLVTAAGCKKDDLAGHTKTAVSNGSAQGLVFNVTDDGISTRSTGLTGSITVLGALRQNPFTAEKLAEAHRYLYQSSVQKMPVTDLYVKFMPATMEHLVLLEDTGEEFYDFPLEYEVVTMGDYYQELAPDAFPVLYAVVKAGFTFPDVPYLVLAELNLSKSDPILLAESFRIAGHQAQIQSYIVGPEGLDKGDYSGDIQARIPPEPECPPGHHAVLHIDQSSTPFGYRWECAPIPPNDPVLNACGCEITGNARRPAGCVRVEDTELSTAGQPNTFLPVRRVKVIAKDTWFTEDETWTNDNGCWQIREEYRGDGWFWVKFKNDRCRIRGAERGLKGIWEWITTKKDYVGKLEGPTFNNIEVNYNMWTEQGFRTHMYWGAATVNNAVHEFHDYAAQDQINPPENGLDIYIGRNNTHGYALMSAQKYLSGAMGTAMGVATFWTGPWSVLIGLIGWGATMLYLPDVYVGIEFQNSDRLKAIAYHELAHASHYSQVGKDYWIGLVEAEILAGGHGDQNSNDAGRIAICESWAGHIGHTYTHRTYGDDASWGRTWLAILEETWNESPNHIPVGLYHDLADMGEPVRTVGGVTFSACNQDGSGCTLIDDQVSGFTNRQMFSCLTSAVTNVDQFRQSLITNHLAAIGNTQAQVNTLFNQY